MAEGVAPRYYGSTFIQFQLRFWKRDLISVTEMRDSDCLQIAVYRNKQR